MKFITLIYLTLFCLIINIRAQEGFEIKVKVTGLENLDIFLGHHYGSKNYLIDTISLNEKGEGVFMGNQELPGGMYFVMFPSNSYFEVIIGDDQHFSLTTLSSQSVREMEVEGSEENQIFFDYQKLSMSNHSKEAELKENLILLKNNPEMEASIRESIKHYKDELLNRKKDIIKDHPQLFVSKVLRGTMFPEIPEDVKSQNDSILNYNYYKDHFLDVVDFSDPRLLRTSLISKKLDLFFKNILYTSYLSLKEVI